MTPKSAVVIRHVHFEDLGTLAAPLRRAGYDIEYRDVGTADFLDFAPDVADLMIVLGGPIGVYENHAYPFLQREVEVLAARLNAGRPTLGICLGAQLIARAGGAQVFPSGIKEIGFDPISLSEAGSASPLRNLDGVPMLHWHGDTYDLPAGATLLASTSKVVQQAFSIGSNILGLQFHAEADTGAAFERWLVGHACELAAAKIDIVKLRNDAAEFGAALAVAADAMMTEWLEQVHVD
ncbi:Gamma-glutamyl-L-1-hydroxyisopropylamide hydrolase [Ensifer sp. M14]|uniref:glutamine amidotransferase n=1 Tax=Ensifer sp. M14 TaxID=2203782 RepID=UPI000E1D6D40|nr:glutamine amidotransferase [Ensifer sp. M14]RDL46468.1 Gamma-glutamyl-L-1-hydroxyisopropylamide hydrolase [Ensifer sp. M14]